MQATERPLADARVPARVLAALTLAAFGWFGLFAHPAIENTDAEVTMLAARAWYERGDPGLVQGSEAGPAERFVAARIAAEPPDLGAPGRSGKGYVWFPIGHQALMLPCVAAGRWLAAWWPETEERYRQLRGPERGDDFWARFCISLLPALFGAGAAVALLVLVRALGCGGAEALAVVGVATLCTQFWPGTTETMSDAPGGFFLVSMAAAVALVVQQGRGAGTAWLAGMAGGAAVLARYPHAPLVALLGLLLGAAALRRRRPAVLAGLLAGGLPWAVALLWANAWRFGDPWQTGYGAGANDAWFSYPPYFGIPAMLLAPGKGALWFSPPLWWALLLTVVGRARGAFVWCAWGALLVPLAVFGHTAGWGAGQCWGIRYLTPGVVLVVAVTLAQARPWRTWTRGRAVAAVLVCALGLLASMGGVLAPYRGQQQLATAAGHVLYPEAGAAVDNNVNADPRLSPLHTHWIYAWLAMDGRLERGGAENTTVPLFGVEVAPAAARLAVPAEDAGFRHWWPVFAAQHLRWPVAWLLPCWLLVTALVGAVGVRGWLRATGSDRTAGRRPQP